MELVMTAEKTLDVLALGEAMIEFNQTKAGEPNYLQGYGGDTSNAAIAAARAGARAGYLTRLGADPFGDALMALWQREGVDTRAVQRDANAHTGIYFVTHGQNGVQGHEFSYRRAGSAASLMTPVWLAQEPAKLIAEAKILHLSGISLGISTQACETALAAMKLARDSGARVAFDSNLRLKLWPLGRARERITQASALCDIFLPSMEDMQALLGPCEPHAILEWGHAQGAGLVALKLGSDGVVVSDRKHVKYLPAIKVKAVDATGAGDCFCGNFLARLALGDDAVEAARYANAAASIAVQGFGAVEPLPGVQAVRKRLASQEQAQ
jgi:2-dehydro-3-deoxygluconokinase